MREQGRLRRIGPDQRRHLRLALLEVHQSYELLEVLEHAGFERRRRGLVAQILVQLHETVAAGAQVLDDDRQGLGRVHAAPVNMKDENVAGLGQGLGSAHQCVAAFER